MLIYLRGNKRIASMTFILNKGKEIENSKNEYQNSKFEKLNYQYA